MVKTLVAFVLLVLATLANAEVCKRCGFDRQHKVYPPNSKQFWAATDHAAKRLGRKLSNGDKKIVKGIITKENGGGNLQAYNKGCFGLGQGKKATYRSTGVPWRTSCPSCQMEMHISYVVRRYRTFSKAWRHHQRRNWY